MSGCMCDGSGFFMTPDADGESAYEVACPDPVHARVDECDVCGLPDPYRGRGDGIGSCDCPRCDGGEAAASSALCFCPPDESWGADYGWDDDA